MKVAWVSIYDSADLRDYDGRGYYAPQSLKNQSISIEHIGSLKIPKVCRPASYLQSRLNNNRFIKPSDRRWYSPQRSPCVVKDYARQISRKLSKLNNVDIVCSGVSQYSQPVAYLECNQPIVIWTDATFASTLNFYPGYFSNEICQESIKNGIVNEKAALSRCKLAIYSSEWGAKGAIKHYQLDPSKVKVVPFGANFECDRNFDDIKTIVDSRPSNRCKLLFLGIDWSRKGGDFALEVAKELNKSGLSTELTIVGCHPTFDETIPNYVHSLGYISNATKEGLKHLYKLFAESHFFIMPSRAESFGHVFCEASSFGVPSLATNVGGIPTAVKDGLNGRTFAIDVGVDEYCTYISNLFSNYSQYKSLALSSFYEYESRLNWSVAGRTVKQLLAELMS